MRKITRLCCRFYDSLDVVDFCRCSEIFVSVTSKYSIYFPFSMKYAINTFSLVRQIRTLLWLKRFLRSIPNDFLLQGCSH